MAIFASKIDHRNFRSMYQRWTILQASLLVNWGTTPPLLFTCKPLHECRAADFEELSCRIFDGINFVNNEKEPPIIKPRGFPGDMIFDFRSNYFKISVRYLSK